VQAGAALVTPTFCYLRPSWRRDLSGRAAASVTMMHVLVEFSRLRTSLSMITS